MGVVGSKVGGVESLNILLRSRCQGWRVLRAADSPVSCVEALLAVADLYCYVLFLCTAANTPTKHHTAYITAGH